MKERGRGIIARRTSIRTCTRLRVLCFVCIFSLCASMWIISSNTIEMNELRKNHTDTTFHHWMDSYVEKASMIINDLDDSLPNTSDGNSSENKNFCNIMVNWVWKEVIPFRYNDEFREVLLSHRKRHLAVSNGQPEIGQKYIIWSLSGGLGNRIQSLGSIFIAALLSKRVLLMKDWFTPLRSSKASPIKPTLLPFVNSGNKIETFRYENLRELFWFSNNESSPRISNEFMFCGLFPMMSLKEFEEMYPNEFRKHENTKEVELYKDSHVKIDIRARHDKKLNLWKHFACTDPESHEIDFFSKQKFVYIWTNQYFLPLFYVNKRTKNIINNWFSTNPFRSILPLIFLPSHPVMFRVLQTMRLNPFLKKRQFVGMHIRSFRRNEILHLVKSFSYCVNRLIDESNSLQNFFLATMHSTVKTYFNDLPLKGKAKFFTIESAQTTDEQSTGQGSVQEWEALTDVVLLSLSKHLFLSPSSTFGFLAAAAGEIESITIVNTKESFNHLKKDMCSVLDGNIVGEPCFASWFRLDSIGHRRHQIGCEMDEMPAWSLKCGTNG
ncbi:putative galactoside 2-alpha-L-fucosyltransferase-like protein [Trypanosoma theileri]|uniref:Putative galactoside 2-alpha-L-fucosyltransferase-like protein n=1 Tax=Trypanosoma theileri TaxID=67003 RepID=A0A1X0P6Y2_9TRYP|nr:putative galactoside 2-alpha-L-fucosyltransferase-like protein [Trypanosoma theileri]ORC92581.1 putative galactoside 2-alpha-L-fucosyltransferase-like protein [Trypanosoma theileri]